MSISPQDLEEIARVKATQVVTGEIVEEDDDEYEMDISEELLAELKAGRDTLRSCMAMLYFFDIHVSRITKRERQLMQKQIERIENRLQEADEVIEKCEEEE